MADLQTYRIVFAVTVEVEASDPVEAVVVADAAAGWPGNWHPSLPPVSTFGQINGHEVEALICRSQALASYPIEEADRG